MGQGQPAIGTGDQIKESGQPGGSPGGIGEDPGQRRIIDEGSGQHGDDGRAVCQRGGSNHGDRAHGRQHK